MGPAFILVNCCLDFILLTCRVVHLVLLSSVPLFPLFPDVSTKTLVGQCGILCIPADFSSRGQRARMTGVFPRPGSLVLSVSPGVLFSRSPVCVARELVFVCLFFMVCVVWLLYCLCLLSTVLVSPWPSSMLPFRIWMTFSLFSPPTKS